MRTISELKNFEIKLLIKYCEKMVYSFKIFDDDTNNLLKHVINICNTELHFRECNK